jgi:hypothetical protein
MLSSHMFVYTFYPERSQRGDLRPSIPMRSEGGLSAPAQTICTLVTPGPFNGNSILFLFNIFACHRSCRGSTGILLSSFLSSPCKRFPLQQGGIPIFSTSSTSAPLRLLFSQINQMLEIRHTFSQQPLCLPHLCFFWPRGVSRKDRATRQPSRKPHAPTEQRLRGARRTPPVSRWRREAAPPGNTARREDGRWHQVKWPERTLA